LQEGLGTGGSTAFSAMPRPATPEFARFPVNGGPTSPPITPTTASPLSTRKVGPNGRAVPPRNSSLSTAQEAPKRNAHASGFPHHLAKPNELSPRSSASSSEEESDEDDSEADSSDSDAPRSQSSDQPDIRKTPVVPRIRETRAIISGTLIIEEMSDFHSDDDRLGVLRPHAIEYADSDRSRSRSRNPPELDRAMVNGIRDLNCSDESEESDLDHDDYQQFLQKQRAARRQRRMTSGSIGKRTISESIGSDTDHEDLNHILDMSDLGVTARRLRRRIGDRRSLQFQDPPPPRIDEMTEPDMTDDDMIEVGEVLAKELPYYTLEYISMEIDSPKSPCSIA